MNLIQSKSPNCNIVDLTCGSDNEGNREMVLVASNSYFEQKQKKKARKNETIEVKCFVGGNLACPNN